jgi:PBP1b-binding outer membrane lipoprotein LpoB
MKDSKFKFILVILLLSFITLMVHWSNSHEKDSVLYEKNKELEQDIKDYKKEIDSLQSEIFIMNIQWNRFEITTEHIFNKYPKIKDEYYEYYEHETE